MFLCFAQCFFAFSWSRDVAGRGRKINKNAFMSVFMFIDAHKAGKRNSGGSVRQRSRSRAEQRHAEKEGKEETKGRTKRTSKTRARTRN